MVSGRPGGQWFGEGGDGVRVPCYRGGLEATGGEFNDERGRRRFAVVFPADDASWFALQTSQPHAGKNGEAAFDCGVAAGLVDDVEVLVEPDRELRVESGDQPFGDPAFRF
jgi:hypothetical protein